jgi:AcrR family transcriptional regulator
MVQVKKDAVKQAILEAGYDLFANQGYAHTSMSEIAKRAKVSPSSIYVYFDSKLALFFDLYLPWFMDQIDDLERRVESIPDARKRLLTIILAMWQELPEKNNVFANNLAQALSTKTDKEAYDRSHLRDAEQRITKLLAPCLPAGREQWLKNDLLAHLIMMAQDGFILSVHLQKRTPRRLTQVADALCDLLMGDLVMSEPDQATKSAFG